MTHGVCVDGVGATQEGTTVANGRISRKGGGGRWADVAHVARAAADTVGLGRWLGRAGMTWCRCCNTENEARRQRIFSRAGSKSGQQRRGIAAGISQGAIASSERGQQAEGSRAAQVEPKGRERGDGMRWREGVCVDQCRGGTQGRRIGGRARARDACTPTGRPLRHRISRHAGGGAEIGGGSCVVIGLRALEMSDFWLNVEFKIAFSVKMAR